MRQSRKPSPASYPQFRELDGRHPFKAAVPDGFVDYRARRLRGGKVVFFNFELAREMGLVPAAHPDTLTPALSRAILDAFCLVIINERPRTRHVVSESRPSPPCVHGHPLPAATAPQPDRHDFR